MPLCQNALSHIRTKLSSYPTQSPFPILTDKQAAYALKFAQKATTKSKQNRQAAVLVPLCSVGGEPAILFTRRSSNVSTHKNQISFPGGHAEECDDSLIETALREAKEELMGTFNYERDLEVLGITASVPAINGNPVTAVLAALNYDFDNDAHLSRIFTPSGIDELREVEVIFTRKVTDLIHYETSEPLKRLGSVGPVFPGPEGKIWGLTAIILRPLLHKVIAPAFFTQDIKACL